MKWLNMLIEKTGYDMDYDFKTKTLIISAPVKVHDFILIKKVLKKMNKQVDIRVE